MKNLFSFVTIRLIEIMRRKTMVKFCFIGFLFIGSFFFYSCSYKQNITLTENRFFKEINYNGIPLKGLKFDIPIKRYFYSNDDSSIYVVLDNNKQYDPENGLYKFKLSNGHLIWVNKKLDTWKVSRIKKFENNSLVLFNTVSEGTDILLLNSSNGKIVGHIKRNDLIYFNRIHSTSFQGYVLVFIKTQIITKWKTLWVQILDDSLKSKKFEKKISKEPNVLKNVFLFDSKLIFTLKSKILVFDLNKQDFLWQKKLPSKFKFSFVSDDKFSFVSDDTLYFYKKNEIRAINIKNGEYFQGKEIKLKQCQIPYERQFISVSKNKSCQYHLFNKSLLKKTGHLLNITMSMIKISTNNFTVVFPYSYKKNIYEPSIVGKVCWQLKKSERYYKFALVGKNTIAFIKSNGEIYRKIQLPIENIGNVYYPGGSIIYVSTKKKIIRLNIDTKKIEWIWEAPYNITYLNNVVICSGYRELYTVDLQMIEKNIGSHKNKS